MFPIGIQSFNDLYSGVSLISIIVISVLNGILLFFASQKFLLSLQQGGYRYNRYFKWLKSPETPYLSRLMLLCLLGFLFSCVLSMAFEPVLGREIASYVGFASYILFTLMYIDTERNVNAKVPLKKTHRLARLSMTFMVFLMASTFGVMTLLNFIAYKIGDETVGILRFSLICVMPILCPYILFLAYCFNEPFEEIRKRTDMGLARAKLKKHDIIKIGITGSYGKTSVKEILNTILSQKFRVLSSPESYNTPLGIAITVKKLDSTHDVFIAEMGARQKGDIKELTNMVKPNVAVLTGINNQHLETFLTEQNIKDTKYELFENMAENGLAFFTSDSTGAVELKNRFKGEKYSGGINSQSNLAYATSIKTDSHGTSFMLHIKGETAVLCRTVLLGKHNVSNICLASAVAYKLGLTPEEIASGINRIKLVGHRLELLPNNKGIIIIDDSYNASEDGVIAAMEVLDKFKGRKIVVTPGLVELGKMENVANFNYGKTLSSHADIVVVIGKHNAETIINGLLEGGFSRENIRFEKSSTRGNKTLNEILKEGDVVLFENDLPDNYS